MFLQYNTSKALIHVNLHAPQYGIFQDLVIGLLANRARLFIHRWWYVFDSSIT